METLAPVPAPAAPDAPRPGAAPWRAIVKPYERPSRLRGIEQVATSLVAFVACFAAMYLLLDVSYWLTLALAPLTAGFLVRTYIVFHDCAHTSLFRSRRANDWVGRICSLPHFTPFYQWRREHAMHHASAGDLDRRGVGDITTLTVDEYLALGRWGRFRYRVYRNPLVLFGAGPIAFQLVMQRFPARGARRRERLSVHATNVAIVFYIAVLGYLLGYLDLVAVYLPVVLLAGGAGIWLFYVQHQFEDTYWNTSDDWDYETAALQGSSYLRLPRILQWFTGNIGLHHVHHLSSRIPNYRLQQAHDENGIFQQVPVLSLWDGIRATRLKLWDERQRRLITWREVRAYQSMGR